MYLNYLRVSDQAIKCSENPHCTRHDIRIFLIFFYDSLLLYLFLKFQFARCRIRIRQKHLRLFPLERDTLLRRVFVLSFNSLIVFGGAPYFLAAMI